MATIINQSQKPFVERLRWEAYCACLTGVLSNAEIPLSNSAAVHKAHEISILAVKHYLEDAIGRGVTIANSAGKI